MLLSRRRNDKHRSQLDYWMPAKNRPIRRFSALIQDHEHFIATYVTPFLYVVSVFLIYTYFTTRHDSHNQSLDPVESYIYNYGTEPVPSLTTDLVAYEKYQYSAELVMLPIAPYKHVAETTDLRATQLIYLDAVREYLKKTRTEGKNKPPQFGFHWKDWVDMHDLDPLTREKPNCFIAGVLGSNVRTAWPGCIDRNTKELDELNFFFQNPATVHESEYRLALRGKTYLHALAPVPNKLIFLTGELAFVVKAGAKQDIKKNGLLKDFIVGRLDGIDSSEAEEEDVVRQPISKEAIMEGIADELDREFVDLNGLQIDFTFLPSNDFELIPKKKKLKRAANAAIAQDKHFANVLVDHDGNKFEANYDWRFFKQTLDFTRHREALHMTIRAFLAMTNNLGLTAWLSQESLIGWARNGIILPWENVVHFELSAKEMAKLASTFNNSLVVTDPQESFKTYFVDVSPHFMERARKNDGNASPEAPDARFIDTNTGVYIELNGVMSGEGRVPDEIKNQHPDESDRFNFVNSGMGKFYHISDLMPLKRTLFEGKLANVPNKAIDIVTADYNDVVTSDFFYNYRYHEHLRLWVPKDKCSYVPKEDINIFAEGGSTYIGACHDEKIWLEYNMTQDATRFRYKEIDSKTQLKLGVKDELPVLYPDYLLQERIKLMKEKYGYS